MKSKQSIRQLWRRFRSALDLRLEESGSPIVAFGLFGLFNYPIFYWVWRYLDPQLYTNLTLRIVAAVLCFFLLVKNYWPRSLKPYFSLYWYFTLLFTLPFFASFMLMMNHGSGVWRMNAMLLLFIFVLLVDWLSFTILFILGGFSAWLCYTFTSEAIFPITTGETLGAVISYLFVILVGIIFAQRRERAQLEKLHLLQTIGASIAHELRTPLLTISSGATGVKQYFPALLHAYKEAQAKQLPIETIRPQHLQILEKSLEDIHAEVNYANTIINMLLMKASQSHMSNHEISLCSLESCVEQALNRYPFADENEKNIVTWTPGNDVEFIGNPLLVIHVIFNLLKNALYYIAKVKKGEIQLWLNKGVRYHELHFRDTGAGIPNKVLSQIFERFYTTNANGTGTGLAFCKMVMEGLGGNIECQSREGEYTEFTLYFPPHKTKD